MARRKQTKGKCVFCEKEMTRGGMARHLGACDKRLEAVAKADAKGGKAQDIFHLQVEDAWGGAYWLHLEMNGSSSLEELDSYLRDIWLECCGHLSEFTVGGWGGEQLDMSAKAAQAFRAAGELIHLYDFGTTSETRAKVVGERRGRPLTRHPIALMARNDPLNFPCMECGEPATQWCSACRYEEDLDGYLCDKHAESHPHEDYGEPLPLVNSPRVGMCGYTGPADPPY